MASGEAASSPPRQAPPDAAVDCASALSAEEAAVYDRQIRLWGMEAQKRLRSSSIVVVGVSAAVAEACKNIVLAGVKSVTILDDGTPLQPHQDTNFLAAMGAASDPACASLAAACAVALRDMNPMVHLTLTHGCAESVPLGGYSALLLGSPDLSTQQSISRRCRALSPPLAIASVVCRGGCGRLVLDLVEQSWKDKLGDEHTTTFPSLEDVVCAATDSYPPLSPPSLYAFRVLQQSQSYPALLQQSPQSAVAALFGQVLGRLQQKRRQVSVEGSVMDNAVALYAHMLQSEGCEAPTVAAIVGGITGQEVVRFLSGTRVEVNNCFYFDSFSLNGSVVRVPTLVSIKGT